MALCFNHPLCYRNNSTTIKKYGYNSKPSISGAKFVVGKYGSGSDKRYYLCESSSATSSNKLATVSGNKYYVNSGYVDVSVPLYFRDGSSISAQGRNYDLFVANVYGYTKRYVTVSLGGMLSNIVVTPTKAMWKNTEYAISASSYTIASGTTSVEPTSTTIISNSRRPNDVTIYSGTITFKITVSNTGSTKIIDYPLSNLDASNQGVLTFRIYA